MSESLQRALAQALLPASILPVLLFGPGLLRAPQSLYRKAALEVHRLGAPAGSGARRRPQRAGVARERAGSPAIGFRGEASLFPGARYAPLRAARRRTAPARRTTRGGTGR